MQIQMRGGIMEVPERIQPKDLADYLDVMSKSVFQTGISWRVVNSKWTGIREAFRGFDPVAISILPVKNWMNWRKINALSGTGVRLRQ